MRDFPAMARELEARRDPPERAETEPDQPPPFRSWSPIDPDALPARDFIYGPNYIRAFVSFTAAPGGLGKSTLVLIEVKIRRAHV